MVPFQVVAQLESSLFDLLANKRFYDVNNYSSAALCDNNTQS
jgi:hypothetical protein